MQANILTNIAKIASNWSRKDFHPLPRDKPSKFALKKPNYAFMNSSNHRLNPLNMANQRLPFLEFEGNLLDKLKLQFIPKIQLHLTALGDPF